jgi:predicted O-methyltransferase YrrM
VHSFKPVLNEWLHKVNARRVWEWGPGLSTELILAALPGDGRLWSVEHDEVWAEKARRRFADARWDLQVQNVTRRVSQYAPCILAAVEPFDLIFVDGRRRVECVMAAMQRLAPAGVILLHDASRKAYTDLILPWVETLEFSHDTLVCRRLKL